MLATLDYDTIEKGLLLTGRYKEHINYISDDLTYTQFLLSKKVLLGVLMMAVSVLILNLGAFTLVMSKVNALI